MLNFEMHVGFAGVSTGTVTIFGMNFHCSVESFWLVVRVGLQRLAREQDPLKNIKVWFFLKPMVSSLTFRICIF